MCNGIRSFTSCASKRQRAELTTVGSHSMRRISCDADGCRSVSHVIAGKCARMRSLQVFALPIRQATIIDAVEEVHAGESGISAGVVVGKCAGSEGVLSSDLTASLSTSGRVVVTCLAHQSSCPSSVADTRLRRLIAQPGLPRDDGIGRQAIVIGTELARRRTVTGHVEAIERFSSPPTEIRS